MRSRTDCVRPREGLTASLTALPSSAFGRQGSFARCLLRSWLRTRPSHVGAEWAAFVHLTPHPYDVSARGQMHYGEVDEQAKGLRRAKRRESKSSPRSGRGIGEWGTRRAPESMSDGSGRLAQVEAAQWERGLSDAGTLRHCRCGARLRKCGDFELEDAVMT